MSFPSWLQNLRTALVPGRGHRRNSLHAATHRPNLEALEDRLTPSFASGGEFLVGPYPQAVVTGDFNNDGKVDVVTTNHGDGTVSVLPGDGLGGFGAARQSAAGADPSTVAAADFNNDGKLDLAVVNQSSAVLSMLLGNGDATFRPPINTAILANPAILAIQQPVAAADFNADGRTDLVYTFDGINGGLRSVEVLLGDGQGGFATRHECHVQTGGLAVADLNADGRPDVVTGNATLLCNRDGTLSYVPAGQNLGPMAIGDFTSDGIPDVVTESSITGTVNILPGRGDGTFAAPIQSFAAYVTGDLATADFDGDGNLDVFTVDGLAGNSALMFGFGNGRFTDPEQGGGGAAVVAADLNSDGWPDLVETWNGNAVEIVLNDGDWGSPPPPPIPSIAISDRTITEGHTGAGAATFTVTLSAASSQPITVAYATTAGTATAGSDYLAASGTLTFGPGETSKTVTVLVNGDRLAEPNETFFVNLSSPTNASVSDGQGIGTIMDDEPRISISDVSKTEGKKNQTTQFTFTVTLSAAYDQAVTVSFQTVNGTATTGDNDYVAQTGTLIFKPGETTKTITIEVKGDSKKEGNETFYVDLSGLSGNSLFSKHRGIGTILNDD
jgi:hypothetical protein